MTEAEKAWEAWRAAQPDPYRPGGKERAAFLAGAAWQREHDAQIMAAEGIAAAIAAEIRGES